MTIKIDTKSKRQVVDITEEITKNLPDGSGVVSVFVKHTTAAITTADLDPGTDEDLLDFFEAVTPKLKWRHPHDPAHAPDHLLSSIVGPNVTVPVKNGRLQLGTWQLIILIEFDGPRRRDVEIDFIQTN